MLRKFALLTAVLTLAIPAFADTPSNAPAHKTSPAKPKLVKPQGKGHKHPANDGKAGGAVHAGFDTPTNAPPPK